MSNTAKSGKPAMSEITCRNNPCTNKKCGFKHTTPTITPTDTLETCSNAVEKVASVPKVTKLPMSQIPCRNNPCTNKKCGFKHEITSGNTTQDTDTNMATVIPVTKKKLPRSEIPCKNDPCTNSKCGFKHNTANLPIQCDEKIQCVETIVSMSAPTPTPTPTPNSASKKLNMSKIPCRNNPCTNLKCGFKHENVLVQC